MFGSSRPFVAAGAEDTGTPQTSPAGDRQDAASRPPVFCDWVSQSLSTPCTALESHGTSIRGSSQTIGSARNGSRTVRYFDTHSHNAKIIWRRTLVPTRTVALKNRRCGDRVNKYVPRSLRTRFASFSQSCTSHHAPASLGIRTPRQTLRSFCKAIRWVSDY